MNNNMKQYLCHMTDAEKKAYNAEYYRNHKNYWEDYYSKGRTVGRPTSHQKEVVSGGNGVKRRGEGLGTGKVGNASYHSSAGALSRGIRVGDKPNNDSKDRKNLTRNYENKIAEREAYAKASQKLKNRCRDQMREADKFAASGNKKEADRMLDLARKSKQEYENYDRIIDDYDKRRIPAAKEAIARYDALSEAHNSGQMNPNKPSVQVKKTDIAKEKVKSKAKQASSDWKAGANTISQVSKDTINSGKKALSRLLSRFR